MCVGKKAAGKKNKFWVGRFSFIQFALEENLIFVTALGALHITFRGFAKERNRKHKSSIQHKRSKTIFHLLIYVFLVNKKWFLRLKSTNVEFIT